jgi:hypothetical protein
MRLVDFDKSPFTGERATNIQVTCRTVEQASLWFGPNSIFARSEEEYLKILKAVGLVPGKEYTIKSVNGYGDLFDVTVAVKGGNLSIMSSFFIDTHCESLKITYINSGGEKKISYIEDSKLYAAWIETIKKMDPNAMFEVVNLEPITGV